MAVLKNARHERFAQELSKGKTATEAYVTAGYEANDGNAARLKGNERITARVSEIQSGAAKRTEITVAELTRELQDILATAKENAEVSAGYVNAARQSIMDIAKLNGLIIDKADLSSLDGSMSPKPTIIEFRAPDVSDEGDG